MHRNGFTATGCNDPGLFRNNQIMSTIRLTLLPVLIILLAGCVETAENKKAPKPSGLKEEVLQRNQKKLRNLFSKLRTAIIDGDIKTIQEIYRLPGNRKLELEEVKDAYRKSGDVWVSKYQNAEIAKELGITIFKSSPPDFSGAKYSAAVPIRFSDGADFLPAAHINGEWKFLLNVNLGRGRLLPGSSGGGNPGSGQRQSGGD